MVPGFLAPSPLTADHRVDAFSCGKAELDLFLKRFALKNQKRDSSRTYVTCPVADAKRVVGYYSLTYASVLFERAPPAVQEGMPKRYAIPVMLLARLAVDESYRPPAQRLRLGSALLKDALLKTVEAARIAGLHALLVDAIDEDAVAWYRRFGFAASPIEEMQLFLIMDQITTSLGATTT